eukprot:Skav207520  [mRNA]  locus=scaffold907:222356:223637:+ [translate_table: standard]
MGLALPILLSSILVLILSFLFAPPKMILGDSLGRVVEIRRSLAKLKLFMGTVSVTEMHPQLDALEYVVQGMKGDHFSSQERLGKVIDLVDDYGWNRGWLMNVGDVKGQILDDALQLRMSAGDVKVALELGTFMGYSTLRLARKLNDTGAEIITVDPDIMAFAVSSSIYNQAGVRNRITMKTDFSQNVFKKLKEEGKQLDFLFIDHVKHLYLPDLKAAVDLQILAPGCVVVGDNVVFPGAPDYREYMLSGEGSKLFKTQATAKRVKSTLARSATKRHKGNAKIKKGVQGFQSPRFPS